jgi:Rod binding domain-containing protein
MDASKLLLTEPVLPPAELRLSNTDRLSDEKKMQAAKDFESLLINKLLDEMKNTITDWDGDEDGASQQIQSIFNLYLSQHIADNGGLGLWKDIYNSMDLAADKNIAPPVSDNEI